MAVMAVHGTMVVVLVRGIGGTCGSCGGFCASLAVVHGSRDGIGGVGRLS